MSKGVQMHTKISYDNLPVTAMELIKKLREELKLSID